MHILSFADKAALVFAILLATQASASFANPDDPAERERFEATWRHMVKTTEAIKALKASGRVVGHERGFLDPIQGAHLSPQEQQILQQENADRVEYFTFLAKNSSSIYRHGHPAMPDKPAVSYEAIARYFSKKWKEWPPQ